MKLEEGEVKEDDGSKSENGRAEAGFEMAADINDDFVCLPQIYISLGLGVFMVIMSIVALACALYVPGMGSLLPTILLGLIAFVPSPFHHYIHWIFQCIAWTCYPFFLLIYFIIATTQKEEWKKLPKIDKNVVDRLVTHITIHTWVCFVPALLQAFLVIRMTIHAVQNKTVT